MILKSWSAMLSKRFHPSFKVGELKTKTVPSTKELFEQLIALPLKNMDTPPLSPCVIVLDALDELPSDSLVPVLDLIADVFESLPSFMRLFVTSRDLAIIQSRLEP